MIWNLIHFLTETTDNFVETSTARSINMEVSMAGISILDQGFTFLSFFTCYLLHLNFGKIGSKYSGCSKKLGIVNI